MITAIAFIAILSVIVFIHEFGHYLFARIAGVKIETFSIGFGKELFGWNDKHGTRWKVSLLPLGGYVKMFGDASEASTPDGDKLALMTPEEKAVSFHYKPLYKKAYIVVAGPLFNFLLTIGIFTYFIFTNGIATVEPIVGDVMPNTPAAEAGLQTDDRILEINGKEIDYFRDITRIILVNTGKPITLVIERDEVKETLTLTPRMFEDKDSLGNTIQRPMLGIKSKKMRVEDVGIAGAVLEAVKQTYDLIIMSGEYLGQLVMGERSAKELKGPVGIAQMSGQAAEQGFVTVLWFMAMLSVNLGFVNLLPIPPLDGGHLLFYAIEGVRGRAMAQRYMDYGYRAGFAMIMMLMAFTLFNDVRNIIL